MHLEGLEQIGLVGLPLQRVGLELAAEGHLRVLLVLPDRRWRPLGHGQGIAQGLVRHHVGHQYHGHVPSAPGPPGPASARCADRPCRHRRPNRVPTRNRKGKAARRRKGQNAGGQSHASILIEAGAGRRTAHLTGPSLDRNISNELGRQGHTGRARSCHGPPALVGSAPPDQTAHNRLQTFRRRNRRRLACPPRETRLNRPARPASLRKNGDSACPETAPVFFGEFPATGPFVSRTCDSTILAARSISHALEAAMMARCSAQP